jgi:hypothetical protein
MPEPVTGYLGSVLAVGGRKWLAGSAKIDANECTL